MKKKLIFLFIFVVSLFIYCNKVDAVVMWMQCTETTDGLMMQGHDHGHEDYKRYNTIATLTGPNNSNSIRHVFVNGNNFSGVNGPVFITQGPNLRSEKIESVNKSCWFYEDTSNDSGGDALTQCDEDDESKYVPTTKFDDKICPVNVYNTTANFGDWGTSGGTKGNFVVLTGTQPAKKYEELKNYEFVLYKANSYIKTVGANYDEVRYDNPVWIMEVYDNTGEYGYFGALPESDGTLINFFNIRTNGEGEGGIFRLEKSVGQFVFDDDFVSWAQARQLISLIRENNNFYKLSEFNKYNFVLLSNVGGSPYEPPVVVSQTDGALVSNGGENDVVWDYTNSWFKLSREKLIRYTEFLDKFNGNNRENGKTDYSGLLDDAIEINNTIKSGKKSNLLSTYTGDKIETTLTSLENVYSEFSPFLPSKRKQVSEKNSFSAFKNCKGIDGLTSDESWTDDPIVSLGSYVLCNTMNLSYKDVFVENMNSGQWNKTYNRPYNLPVVEEVFSKALARQIKLSGIDYEQLSAKSLYSTIADDSNLLLRFASYIKKENKDLLSESQLKRLNTIIDNYSNMLRDEFHMEVPLDCNSLLGSDFINKISRYVDIIRIAIPIILTVFGILDFVKAFFADNQDKMKEAQKKFLLRIVIAILFFLLPLFIKLLLTIANKAWNFISPDSCGIF